MVDVRGPVHVQVQISDGGKLWVNVDGVCKLRVYDAVAVEVTDDRTKEPVSRELTDDEEE